MNYVENFIELNMVENSLYEILNMNHIEIPYGIWYTLFISNDRNGVVNWRTIRRNNGMRKKKL